MIEADSLTKHYGGKAVVEHVSFRCEPGTVTGFLGPNGAGKSTTLKMICGLTRPTAGHATVGGVPYTQLPNPGVRVGVLLDASAQHAGRRGREVLAASAQLMKIDPARADAMLTRVGLDRRAARRRVGKYSLGMRQRLGIAHALLGDPQVLILDEPANGLDPEGMRWMRELLRDFADRGGTVLLSSHLLTEIDAIADRLVVISQGRIVAAGTLSELRGHTGSAVEVRTAGGELTDTRLQRELDRLGITIHALGDGRLRIDADASTVGNAALNARVALTELAQVSSSASLEQLFFELTASDQAPDEQIQPKTAGANK